MYSDNLNHIHRMTDMGLYKVVKLKRGETPLGNKRKFIEALNSNPWLFADIHVSANINRTNNFLNKINSVVSENDNIVCLGDLMNKHTGTPEEVRRFVNGIKCKNKFLILGNHDFLKIEDYIDMGFVYVTDHAAVNINNKKVIFTHCPIPVKDDIINIHGHIHGSGKYWNMSPERHYDVFIGTDESPDLVRYNTLLNLPDLHNDHIGGDSNEEFNEQTRISR